MIAQSVDNRNPSRLKTTSRPSGKAAFERAPRKPVPLEVRDENIPAALRQRSQWVNWKYHWKEKEHKWTKLPVAATTGKVCDITDPHMWSSFDEALAYYRAYRSRIDGIGYAFSKDDPFSGVDLDDALDPNTGAVRDWAKPLIVDLDSYTELSPSRTGVKVFLRGKLPAFAKRHRKPYGEGEIEIYDSKRFFVVTGHRLADCPLTVEDRQPQLDALYRLVLGVEEKVKDAPRPKPTGSKSLANLDDAALLDKAMNAANGDRFRRLWNGDTSDHDYDHSRADLALCCSLAFWTGGDAHQMDCLFRASGLMRDKWDERRGDKSYGQLTINKALARVADHYTPGQIGSSPTTTAKGDEAKTDTHGDCQPEAADCPPPGAAPKAEPPNRASSYQCQLLSSTEFAVANYELQWLVQSTLVRGLPVIVGGPRKCLKTSLLLDLALSLGSGTPFLGQLAVSKPVRTAVLSAESGPFTLKETALRICAAKGIRLGDTNTLWGFDLPQLANPQHLEELHDGLVSHGIEVAIIDPLYIALLSGAGAKGLEASNLFDMGPLLRTVATTCLSAGCTPLLSHHAPERVPAGKPLELDDLAFAGFQEFARQWLLVNRRVPFNPEQPGCHQLWLSVGGSVGLSKLWAVDIEEGELLEDFTGRRWDVTVQTGREEIASQAEDQQRQREQKLGEKLRIDAGAVLSAMSQLVGLGLDQKGVVKEAEVQARAGLSASRMTAAVLDLLKDRTLEKADFLVQTGKNLKVTRPIKGLRRASIGQQSDFAVVD